MPFCEPWWTQGEAPQSVARVVSGGMQSLPPARQVRWAPWSWTWAPAGPHSSSGDAGHTETTSRVCANVFPREGGVMTPSKLTQDHRVWLALFSNIMFCEHRHDSEKQDFSL